MCSWIMYIYYVSHNKMPYVISDFPTDYRSINLFHDGVRKSEKKKLRAFIQIFD